jgi:NADH-quinone oxidoreductase subunit N
MKFDLPGLLAIMPLVIVVMAACVMLIAETFVRSGSRQGLAAIGVVGQVAALVFIGSQWSGVGSELADRQVYFEGMVVVDRMALLLDATFLITGIITLLLSSAYMREHGFEFGEFHALVLLTVSGMMMVAHASHMLSLLIGIETMSLGAYVLTGSWRRSARSTEGALKYYLMGAFATSFLVYGMALVYGTTDGALSYEQIAGKVDGAASSPLFLMGLYFILGALLFKVAAVPFHMWTPDAYEGAPTTVTGFMAAGVKAAAFAAIARLVLEALPSQSLVADATGWVGVVWWFGLVTMIIGNVAAVRQENVKRMLAYSSIAHAGYVLVGIAALGLGVANAKASVLFYLVAYTFTTLGAFGVVAWIGRRGDERLFVDDWAGLGQERPGAALAMTVFLLSLGGVPPTGGFFAKFYLFRSAMESPYLVPLVVAGVATSVVSIFYYLRIVVAMYFRDPVRLNPPLRSSSMGVAVLVSALAVLALGLFPGTVIDWAEPAKAVKEAVAQALGG